MSLGHKSIRPVFIIGSYRSATSALTWALGQHPNLFPLEETHFLYKLAVDVDNLYELGTSQGEFSFLGLSGYTSSEFRGYFADSCRDMVLQARRRIDRRSNDIGSKDPARVNHNVKLHRGWWQPKRRWVDGTPENSFFVLPLLRLFPEARFIHILRNPRLVATSLMHFSTMGACDYAEEDAYRTWTRLVRSAALAEQAFGPDRVMRLEHGDLLADPRDALARCLAFAGERYHKDCLLPLREKLNSSRYGDVGDCSIEAHLDSPSPWIREAFELYARLQDDSGTTRGDPAAALDTLESELREYRTSLKPDTNEKLAREVDTLKQRIVGLEQERRQLKRQAGNAKSWLAVLDWGPRDEIFAGAPFNAQPDGANALWIRTKSAPPDTVVVLNDVPLATQVASDGSLVTASVPPAMTNRPGAMTMYLHSPACEETSLPVPVTVAV